MNKFLIHLTTALNRVVGIITFFQVCFFAYILVYFKGFGDTDYMLKVLIRLASSCLFLHSAYLIPKRNRLGFIIPFLLFLGYTIPHAVQGLDLYLLVFPSIYLISYVILEVRKGFSSQLVADSSHSQVASKSIISSQHYWAVPIVGLILFFILARKGFLPHDMITVYSGLALVAVIALIVLMSRRYKRNNQSAISGANVVVIICMIILMFFFIGKYIKKGVRGRVKAAVVPTQKVTSKYLELLDEQRYEATRSLWYKRGVKKNVVASAVVIKRLNDLNFAREEFYRGDTSYSQNNTNVVKRIAGAPKDPNPAPPDYLGVRIDYTNKEESFSRHDVWVRKYVGQMNHSDIEVSISIRKSKLRKELYIIGIYIEGEYTAMQTLLDGIDHDFEVREIRRGPVKPKVFSPILSEVQQDKPSIEILKYAFWIVHSIFDYDTYKNEVLLSIADEFKVQGDIESYEKVKALYDKYKPISATKGRDFVGGTFNKKWLEVKDIVLTDKNYNQAIQLSENDPFALVMIANRMFEDLQSKDESTELLEQALALVKKNTNGREQIIGSILNGYNEMGEYSKAYQLFLDSGIDALWGSVSIPMIEYFTKKYALDTAFSLVDKTLFVSVQAQGLVHISRYIDNERPLDNRHREYLKSMLASVLPSKEKEIRRLTNRLNNLKPPIQTVFTIVASSDYHESREADTRISLREDLDIDGGLNINPDKGGNIGAVTVRISGVEFSSDTEIWLTRPGEDDIVGKIVKVEDSQKIFYCTFELWRNGNGVWTLQVKDRSNNVILGESQFQIVEVEEPRLELEIVGPQRIGINTPAKYSLVYRNTGNIDIAGAHVGILGIPKDGTIRGDFRFIVSPLNLPDEQSDDPVFAVESGMDKSISFSLMTIPAGFAGKVNFEISVPSDIKFTLKALGF